MMTSIPFFRNVILMAFECPHCGFRSSELQSASVSEKGCRYEVTVATPRDLNRSVVRTEHAAISIPELQFEMPAIPDRPGELTTVEGVIRSSVEKLEELQPLRRAQVPEQAAQIDLFLDRLRALLDLGTPFTFILDDPTGNGFIENLNAPRPDPNLVFRPYERTMEQCQQLGLNVGQELVQLEMNREAQKKISTKAKTIVPQGGAIPQSFESECIKVARPEDIVEIPTSCSMCHRDGVIRMIVAHIPMFKEIVLMAFTCNVCGYRNAEVKPGGATAPHGQRITLHCTTAEDLSRDVLKSDTATVHVLELEMEVVAGSLGGMFTTIEGLMRSIRDRVATGGGCHVGDSIDATQRTQFAHFLETVDAMIEGRRPFHLVLDDPVSNSYIQNLCSPDPDPALTVEHYVRTKEQDDELGISEMRTEGYETPEAPATSTAAPAEPTPPSDAPPAAPTS